VVLVGLARRLAVGRHGIDGDWSGGSQEEVMSGVKLPGVVWVVLLVGLPMVVDLIETQYGGEWWAELTAGVLMIVFAIVKGVQVYGATGELPKSAGGAGPQFEAAEPPSKARQLLWG
jgi:hypothetical protein